MAVSFIKLACSNGHFWVLKVVDSQQPHFSTDTHHYGRFPAVFNHMGTLSLNLETTSNFSRYDIFAIVGADWLQGPHVYALFSSYGMTSKQINQLFVVGFGSSLAFGTVVGSFADKL